MVKVSYQQKPYRRAMMETYGANVYPSPSDRTNAGRTALSADPNTPGSLGLAISEAVEVAVSDDSIKYSLGSVLNHVLLHQTIVGLETMEQLSLAGDAPDIIIGCAGGGSNFAGLSFPFIGAKLRNELDARFIAVEPTSCPTLTKGTYAYDFGDTANTTPLIKMHTLGSSFIPPGIHAGGLRYHGMAPMMSHLVELGIMEARSEHQLGCFDAGVKFAAAEGIIPAPESTHAIKVAMDEALRCKAEGVSQVILFNLSGHGHFDMQAYTDYFAGKLHDYEYSADEVNKSLAGLPKV
jgi:tryptophan synthase beta chain